MTEPTPRTRFRRADDRINKLASDPLIADDVRRHRTERETVNRIYAEGLADIRKASNLHSNKRSPPSTPTRHSVAHRTPRRSAAVDPAAVPRRHWRRTPEDRHREGRRRNHPRPRHLCLTPPATT